jgi:hypothetical protein
VKIAPPTLRLHSVVITLQQWPALQVACRSRSPMTVDGRTDMVPTSYTQSGYGANFRCVADFQQILRVA